MSNLPVPRMPKRGGYTGSKPGHLMRPPVQTPSASVPRPPKTPPPDPPPVNDPEGRPE
jgi:hypothetical protein